MPAQWVVWYFAIHTYPSRIDPTFITFAIYIQKLENGVTVGQHFLEIVDQDPLWSDPQVFIDGYDYSADYYHKWGRLAFYDNVGQEWIFFPFDITVPPFNGGSPIGDVFFTQSHEIAPPPPEVQPAPPTVPPTPIRPEPPVTVVEPWEPEKPPQPVTLPPPTEPPPIDWQPGPLPPDVVPPPRTRDTDIFTLRAFAEKWGDQVTRYALNVPLDSGEIVDDLEEPYRTLWSKLTAHKADLVFERKGIIYVAEIKPRLSRGAIGEAITAHELFKRLHKPKQETRAAVICLTAHPILVQTAGWLGVLVFVVEQVDTGQPAGLYRPLGRERT